MSSEPSSTSQPQTSSDQLSDQTRSNTVTQSGRVVPAQRETFETHELAIVMSHFDIGVIEAIQEFPRGSRKAPKLLVKADTGLYLLKRRARGKDDPYKVAFCHQLQLYLANKQFPLPHLIGTKKENNSMMQWSGTIYELFEYIKGTNYDQSLEATTDAGKILALYHKLLSDFKSEYEPPEGSYHNARSVDLSFKAIPKNLSRLDARFTDPEHEVYKLLRFLHKAYRDAAKQADDLGLEEWPKQIVHGDWHPGNMLFRGPRVVAVIDYDAARIHQRVIDVANGALQFSILTKGESPDDWPDYADESRYKRFLRGYDAVPKCVLSKAELKVVPWLMIEALVAESIIPIATTGSFARLETNSFLRMVARKTKWLQDHAEALSNILDAQ